ncbi:unnamed protein product [Caenorhabditis bovis]|uniref:Uncharacterized protein n=1 Tax=Caenorhabditis bovis TaxID=2654633 RepID=A0A8S1EZI4_9PELO|nr:unnamed protein product [Caenorhabditis bovis]
MSTATTETRKMKLLFCPNDEKIMVKIRADGLRSRMTRSDANSQHIETAPSSTSSLQETIEEVARCSLSRSSETTEQIHKEATIPKSVARWKKMMERNPNCGNLKYHAPRKFHAQSTMVENKNRWSYQKACEINEAEKDAEGQMYYIADPFLPMPRTEYGESAAIRMNYAAQRLDNRRFRCEMRYFLPSKEMQQRITYIDADAEEELPIALFNCAVCKTSTKLETFS